MEDGVQVVEVDSWGGWLSWDGWLLLSGLLSLNSVLGLELSADANSLEVSNSLWGGLSEHSHDNSLLWDTVNSDIEEGLVSNWG